MNVRASGRAAIAAFLVAAAPAFALPGGTIGITDQAMDPTSKTFERDLKKAQKTSLKADSSGHWKIYLIAYLNKAPGADEVNAVFYPVGGPKGEEPNAFPIQTKATAKILMTDLDVSPEQGIKPGKYEI